MHKKIFGEELGVSLELDKSHVTDVRNDKDKLKKGLVNQIKIKTARKHYKQN